MSYSSTDIYFSHNNAMEVKSWVQDPLGVWVKIKNKKLDLEFEFEFKPLKAYDPISLVHLRSMHLQNLVFLASIPNIKYLFNVSSDRLYI